MKIHEQEPIFIVGFPRSGTTLLAAMLARHSQLSCGPETRFFHFLEKSDPNELMVNWPDNALDFLFSLHLTKIPVPEHFSLSRADLRSYLSLHVPSISILLSSLCEQFMLSEGKKRWVEKSPEHLRQVYTIREYFPEAHIIRIIRDPRDTALSMVKMPWASRDYLEAILLWREYDDKSAKFFQNDHHSFSLHFEELVENPGSSLRNVCEFLGVRFEDQMLNTSRSTSSVITSSEPWKDTALKPIDKSRIYVWKREVSVESNHQVEAVIGDRLRDYGYETIEQFNNSAQVYPSIYKLFEYRDSFYHIVEMGTRFWQDGTNEGTRILIFVGDPDLDGWLSHQKPRRWLDALRIAGEILLSKPRQQEIFWVRTEENPEVRGITSQFISLAFGFSSGNKTSKSW